MAHLQRMPDQKYVREWRTYRTFVDAKRLTGQLLHGPKYLMRVNVDHCYFTEVVQFYDHVQPETAIFSLCGERTPL